MIRHKLRLSAAEHGGGGGRGGGRGRRLLAACQPLDVEAVEKKVADFLARREEQSTRLGKCLTTPSAPLCVKSMALKRVQ